MDNDLISHSEIRGSHVGDRPSMDDALGFTPYVDAVAQFLADPDTDPPLTISIEGEWGSGKSTFMGFLRKKIKEIEKSRSQPGQKAHFVCFNPWKYEKGEELWVKFAQEFMRQVAREDSEYDANKAFVELMKYRLTSERGTQEWYKRRTWKYLLLAGALSIVAGWNFYFLIDSQFIGLATFLTTFCLGYMQFGTVMSWLEKHKIITPAISDLKKRVNGILDENNVAFVDRFHEDFHKITQAFVGSESRIYIFIDDIDRCETPKAANLMQWIHLMLSEASAKMIFIIGMDREKVAASIAAKHRDILSHLGYSEGGGKSYGHSFIEKFIQIPFQVPRPSQNDFETYLEYLSGRFEKQMPDSDEMIARQEINLAENAAKTEESPEEVLSKPDPDPKQPSDMKSPANLPTGKIKGSRRKRSESGASGTDAFAYLATHDSKVVHSICLMVHDALDDNPRRVKTFLNLLRLKIYIACETGLLADSGGDGKVTTQQLGKFVAIWLRWPDVILELSRHPGSLKYLQDIASKMADEHGVVNSPSLPKKDSDEGREYDEWFYHLTQNRALIRLLKAKFPGADGATFNKVFSLSNLPLEKLLSTSPKVVTIKKRELGNPDQKILKEGVITNIADSNPEGHKEEGVVNTFAIDSFGPEIKKPTPKDGEMNRRAVIKVIGVGGGGANAVGAMLKHGIPGVEFIVCNTDAQALAKSPVPKKLQIGGKLTRGLGAGANPEIGRKAAMEDADGIRAMLEGADLAFIAAGLGGGTGTGAAPVVAEISRKLGILTVGLVTRPFVFEGAKRRKQAESGLEELLKVADTTMVIPNQRLLGGVSKKNTLNEAFQSADKVLVNAVKAISDIIMVPGLVNVDFLDLEIILGGKGLALIGTGNGSGKDRAREAAQGAISHPFLVDTPIESARGILINITGGTDLSLFEVNDAAMEIQKMAHVDAEIIFGAIIDENLKGEMSVAVIAAGIQGSGDDPRPFKSSNLPTPVDLDNLANDLDIPTFIRTRQAD